MGSEREQGGPTSYGGVIPNLSLAAELGPPRTECAVGALMPWAGKLWAVSYVSTRKNGGLGTGLYEIDKNLRIKKHPQSRVGVYTNRFVHFPSNQIIIGPHVIDDEGHVRTIKDIDIRICGTMSHLKDPDNMVYLLGMEGEFLEMNVHSLKFKQIGDLVKELSLPEVHFKAGYTGFGRVVVANNAYDNEEFVGRRQAGCLAEWDGSVWHVVERNPFVEVTGRGPSVYIFAVGWDRASSILKVFVPSVKKWLTYRLPKGSHTYDHMWATEWPRIRETEHERFLMDCHGIFYELPQWNYGGKLWGVQPICRHLWVLGDFCTYRGMLVLGADNASPASGQNPLHGEPQSGIWLGKTDDLWQFGKPVGWGGPWWETTVKKGEPSDPYLMTGFDKKSLHIAHNENKSISFTVEIDFVGDGSWKTYGTFSVSKNGYMHHEFPDGFSAHWIRMRADKDCTATAYLIYS